MSASLRSLAPETFSEIFTYLNQYDLFHLCLVDRFFRDLLVLRNKLETFRKLIDIQFNFWHIQCYRNGNGAPKHRILKNKQIVVSDSFIVIDNLLEPFLSFFRIDSYPLDFSSDPQNNLSPKQFILREFLTAHGLVSGDFIFFEHKYLMAFVSEHLVIQLLPDSFPFLPTGELDSRIFAYWKIWRQSQKLIKTSEFWDKYTFLGKTFFIPKLGFHLQF